MSKSPKTEAIEHMSEIAATVAAHLRSLAEDLERGGAEVVEARWDHRRRITTYNVEGLRGLEVEVQRQEGHVEAHLVERKPPPAAYCPHDVLRGVRCADCESARAALANKFDRETWIALMPGVVRMADGPTVLTRAIAFWTKTLEQHGDGAIAKDNARDALAALGRLEASDARLVELEQQAR